MLETARETGQYLPQASTGDKSGAGQPSGLAAVGRRIATLTWFVWGLVTDKSRVLFG